MNEAKNVFEPLIENKKGQLEPFDDCRIIKAIEKSARRVAVILSGSQKRAVCAIARCLAEDDGKDVATVEDMHRYVELALDKVRPEVAKAYRDYRDNKEDNEKTLERVNAEIDSTFSRGDRSNGNVNSFTVSAKSALTGQAIRKVRYEKMIPKDILNAANEGYIYIHDKAFREITMNCCLYAIKKVLEGGFEMGNIFYTEPKSLDVAFDVIGDIVMTAASQQYGGFTLPQIDEVLEKYAKMSYDEYYAKYLRLTGNEAVAKEEALHDVARDYEQGIQGWEHKFNTVASSRGDYPFIAVTFGLARTELGVMGNKIMLRVHKEGQGKPGYKKPVLFPKMIFLYDENLHGEDKELNELFEAGIDCSCETMYPDWLSLTGEGYVADMYKKYGAVISPMGCRAFLSPWYERGGMNPADENDKPVFIGRHNLGVVSLNLPQIYLKSQAMHTDFYAELDHYLEMIRRLHLFTYEWMGEQLASINPLAYCEGGFYGGNLRPDQKLKESPTLLPSATLSFGITALNELQLLKNGKTIREDGEFAIKVMEYINNKIDYFKKEDGKLYAIYGTPAESLCGLQIEQLRTKTKEWKEELAKSYEIFESCGEYMIKDVTENIYVTNSFHCHVKEDMSQIEKQDKEARFWNLFNGGKIQYVRYPLKYNREAVKTFVKRAMKMGFYEGVNLALGYCDDCGCSHVEGDVCPECGSTNLTKIDRMNGYLSYSRIKGDTRLNKAKMAEIADRKSM